MSRLAKYGTRSKVLGRGTYGKVSRYESEEGSKYAIKRITVPSAYEIVDETTLREVAFLSLLRDSPYVVKLLDFSVVGGKFYLVMPLADGSLRDLKGPTPGAKLRMAYDICRGVLDMHNRNILNRDIKPDNVLYTVTDGEYRVQLADFGLAIDGICNQIKDLGLGAYTLWYRPPEILLGGSYSYPADIWALGCTLYELLTGRALFPSTDENDQLKLIYKMLGTPRPSDWREYINLPGYDPDTPDYPYMFNDHITRLPMYRSYPHELWYLLVMMLQYDPARRPTASEVVNHPGFATVRSAGQAYPLLSCTDRLNLDQRYPPAFLQLEFRLTVLTWLYEIDQSIKRSPRAFPLAVYLFDLITSRLTLRPPEYQLYGAVAYFIASRIEDEIIETFFFVAYSNSLFNEEQFGAAFGIFIENIDYRLTTSTVIDYLKAYSAYYSNAVNELAEVLGHLVLLTDEPFIRSADQLALATLIISCKHYYQKFNHGGRLEADPDLLTAANSIPFKLSLTIPSDLRSWVEDLTRSASNTRGVSLDALNSERHQELML